MNYEKILRMSYNETKNAFGEFESISNRRKIITFKNNSSLGTYSEYSDVIAYYDVVGDSQPLLLVERLMKNETRVWYLKQFVKKMNKTLHDYVLTVEISKHRKFIDIIILKKNIYNSLVG